MLRDAGRHLGNGPAVPLILLIALVGLLHPSGASAASPPVAFGPFSGTAQVTFIDCLLCQVGVSTLSAVAEPMMPITETVHFAVRDLTHYRVDIQTTSPAILAGTRTVVLNGPTMTIDDGRSGTAGTFPVPITGRQLVYSGAADFLQELVEGNDLSANHPISGYPLPQATDTSSTYLARLQATLPNAHVAGQDTALGQQATIVASSTQNSDIRVWVGKNTPVLLRYEAIWNGTPETSYTLTSYAPGVGPSDADLAFHPSVPTTNWDRYPGTSAGSPGWGSTPSKGFVVLPIPPGIPDRCAFDGYQEQGLDYTAQTWQTLYVPDQATCSQVEVAQSWSGAYILVQQERQAGGLPSWFSANGQVQTLSGCAVYTGAYQNGQLWAALERDGNAVEITTNSLNRDQLLQYAGAVCNAPISTASAIPPAGTDPSLWYCAFGGPQDWQIFIYKYAQQGEQCFKHLDQAVDVIPPSVTKIVPKGATGYLTCSGGEANAALDPPGGVYVTRCPGTPLGYTAQWSGFPTDGPHPIKGAQQTSAQPQVVTKHKSHKGKKHKRHG